MIQACKDIPLPTNMEVIGVLRLVWNRWRWFRLVKHSVHQGHTVDGREIHVAPRNETMVEAIVGIHVGESTHARVSERWCEMDFATIHSPTGGRVLGQTLASARRACAGGDSGGQHGTEREELETSREVLPDFNYFLFGGDLFLLFLFFRFKGGGELVIDCFSFGGGGVAVLFFVFW